MFKKLFGLFGAAVAASGAAADGSKAQQTVQTFASVFLDEAAQARLADVTQAGYGFEFVEVAHKRGFDPSKMSDTDWGHTLIEELTDFSGAEWLDWKYNIYSMIDEDGGGTGLLDLMFKQAGVAPISDAERQAILAKAEKLGEDASQRLLMPDLQPLAVARGIRLMLIDNHSDGLVLFTVPDDKADAWHVVQIGDILIFRADKGMVPDPRANGKLRRLAN